MSNVKTKQISPIFWIPSLYFAMGLPFWAVNATSGIMFKNMGISDTDIAFWTTIIIFPWTLKPLWSPFLEIYKTRKFFVLTTQLFTGICFALIALALPLNDYFTYTIALLGLIALSGSTHDIAADGVYINELSSEQQSKWIGWQGAFFNVAKVVSLSVFVYIAGALEEQLGLTKAWMAVMGIYALVMITIALYHTRILPSTKKSSEQKTAKEAINTTIEVLTTFFKKKNIIWSVAFIILYRFAEGFAMKISPLFLVAEKMDGGLGLSNQQVSLVMGFGAGAFILGSILGGNFIAKYGLKKVLLPLALIFNIPFVVYTIFAFSQPENIYYIIGGVTLEYFGYGFGFVGLILFMMQQVAPGKYKMAHYAFASGIMNLGLMIPSMMSGAISDWLGYKLFFVWVLVAAIPAILAAKLVPFSHPDNKEEKELEKSTN
jgi:PAT family beta-lactamase induction signal transducer AmpG